MLNRNSSRTAVILATVVILACICASGQTLTTLYNFGTQSGDGADPSAGVVFDKAGNLYGAASIGGVGGTNGILYALSPPESIGDPWTKRTLYAFRGTPDAAIPECRVKVSTNGKLFGTTWGGGKNNLGTVFVASRPSSPGAPWIEKVLYNFGSFSADGQNPNAGLLPGNGVFYGVTFGGGADGRGTVFQLTPPTGPSGQWTVTILYSFAATIDAAFPSSELVMDNSGNLYGTTTLGGSNNDGAVYELAPPDVAGQPWTETVIHSFNGTDGTLPAGRLVFDSKGALYGTTDGGGTAGEGTVFKLTPPSRAGDPWTESVLYSFSGGKDGSNPTAGVVIANTGKLYGTAQHGGNGFPKFGGVIFELDPPAIVDGPWIETVLHSFNGDDGFAPASPLVLRNGSLYGTTSQGGFFGTGTVFSFTP
jgi:uncharacterized repeat protein (TIGR03803 family)